MSQPKYVLLRAWMTPTLAIRTEVYGPFNSEADATNALRHLRPATSDALRIQQIFTLPPEEPA